MTLKEILDEFKFYPALLVHWILVGPSNRKTRPERGGVLQHYQRCMKQPRPVVKAIANSFYTESVTWHPHNMVYRCAPPRPARFRFEHRCWSAACSC